MFAFTHVATYIKFYSRYHRYITGFPFSCALNELYSTTPCNVVPPTESSVLSLSWYQPLSFLPFPPRGNKPASLSRPGLPRVSAGKGRPQSTCNSGLMELTAPAAATKPKAWTTKAGVPFSWPVLSRGLCMWSSFSSLDSPHCPYLRKEFYIPLQSPWAQPRNLVHPFSSYLFSLVDLTQFYDCNSQFSILLH